MKRNANAIQKNANEEIILLNIRGTRIEVLKNCMEKNYPQSQIAQLFREYYQPIEELNIDEPNACYIDSEPYIFSHIIHYVIRDVSFELIPVMTTREAWFRELEHFGLYDRNQTNTRVVLSEFDQQMKQKFTVAKERIETIILLLPELCSQAKTIENGAGYLDYYIPKDVYQTTWGQDLYAYLLEAKHWISYYLKEKKFFSSIEVTKIKTNLQKVTNYTFNNVTYASSVHETIHFQLYYNYS